MYIPDMGYRDHKFNMPHSLTPDFFFGDLHPTAFTFHALMAGILIAAAVTLIIPHGTEYSLTEKAITLRLKSPVIDSLGFLYFPIRPL